MSSGRLTAESAEDADALKNAKQATDAIIGATIELHQALGPGLLESTYEMCLCRELSIRRVDFERQVPIPAEYKGVKLHCGYRADIVVEHSVLVEIKAIDSLLSIHEAQLLSYLKLGGWKIGPRINFNVELLKRGIRRRVLNLIEEIEP
jgi:GxxExxY protein